MGLGAYSFTVASALTGAPYSELPLLRCQFTRTRNAAGPWSGSLKLNDSDALARLDLLGATQNNEWELVIERNGKVVYSGLLIDTEYDSTTQELAISGFESWAYFDRRLTEATLNYANIDQGLIVQDLLTRAAAAPRGDFRVDLPTTAQLTTGVVRNQSYVQAEPKPISEAIEELAAMTNGFEFSLNAYWSGNVLRHAFNFGFPMIGARGGLITQWDLPGFLQKYRWQKQGGGQATEIFGLGDDGSGHTKLQRVLTLSLELPLLQVPQSFRAQVAGDTLLAQTQRAAAKSIVPLIAANVTVLGSGTPQVGDFALGDDVALQFKDPYMNNVSTLFRLAGYTVTVPQAGSGPELVDLAVEAM